MRRVRRTQAGKRNSEEKTDMREKLLLIDGHSILNRAFYGIPPLTNSEGLHTNAVYGFLNILFHVMDEEQAQYLAVAFDLSAPTFRHKIYDAYKGTRKGMPEELREQVPVMKEMLQAMGIQLLMLEGYEADDLIGTVSRQAQEAGMDVTILSGDRDLLQLASDQVCVRIPKTKQGKTEVEDYHTQDVIDKYQVTPAQIIELKALMGDASDNIPGIPGVGEKTAQKIIAQFGSIENAYAHADEVTPNRARVSLTEHYDLAQLSKTLATINRESPVELDLESARVGDLFTPEALEICRRLELRNLLSRFEGKDSAPEALRMHLIRTGAELSQVQDQIVKAAGSCSILGISLPQELTGGSFYALSPAADDQVTDAWCLIEGPDLDQEQIRKTVKAAVSAAPFVSALGLKEQLHVLEAASGSSEDPDGDREAASAASEEQKFAGKKESSFYDVSLGAYLLNPLKGTYTYDEIARTCANLMFPSELELAGKKKGAEDDDAREKLAMCACYEAAASAASVPGIRRKLEETGMTSLMDEMEMPLLFTLYGMQKAGIAVRGEELTAYGERLSGRIAELEESIREQAGEKFNINSPKQLGVILFEKLQMPYGKKTKTGYSTSADVLDKLSAEYPIVADILEYRQLTKLKSTYADGLSAFIREDGRIHGRFNQTITATGRISSTDPNLQNIPVRTQLGRELRKVFVPRDGYVFVDADYSQIELRVLAHMSGDERLIEAYAQAQDIHAITASQVFHIPPDEVTPLERRNAKAVNFGIVYGISSFGLSQDLSISRKEAEEYIRQYFITYPGIKEFLDGAVSSAKEKGYSVTLFGRRRPIPELKDANFMRRSFGERVAMNAPIQGTAADIIKIAMIRVDRRLKKECRSAALLLQIHDELLVEVRPEEQDQVMQILREEMMGAAKLKVALEIDMHAADSWYDAK